MSRAAGAMPGAMLVRRAEAKVNLALAITGLRPDGYHTLRSVFLRLDHADELRVSVMDGSTLPQGSRHAPDRLIVEGDPDCPVDGNLVLRATSLLRSRAPDLVAPGRRVQGVASNSGPDLPPLEFRLTKRIAMGAGLAGGSSDAIGALDLAAEAWGLHLHPAARLEAALLLGADVPFFAAGHACALVGGIGEGLVPLPGLRGRVGVLLVTPSVRLATAAVFRVHDDDQDAGHPSRAQAAVDDLAEAFRGGLEPAGLAAYAHRLRDANDLWPAAVVLAPGLASLRDEIEAACARPALMTGSGSTLFCLYASHGEAAEAAEQLPRACPSLASDPRARVVVTTDSSEERA